MSSNFKHISGGVNASDGFSSASAACGIKRSSPAGGPLRNDLCLVVSDTPAAAAGVFTTNLVKAAPVLLSRQHLEQGKASAVLLNSGNANACTGELGERAAEETAIAVALALDIPLNEVLVCSTGRIGVQLPIAKMIPGIESAAWSLQDTPAAATEAAKSIMTSDSVPKQSAYEVILGKTLFRIGGMAKGAGMISPNMATMLCVITTDAAVSSAFLQKTLSEVVGQTFNCISVDGDCSTNDTVLALANGASEVTIKSAQEKKIFAEALHFVCADLARAIVADGEGTSRVIALTVTGTKSDADAHQIARSIANSQLVKCAWAGGDPNWGRILCAAGYAGVSFDPGKVEIMYDSMSAAKNGMECQDAKGEAKLRNIAAKKEFAVTVDFHSGKGQARLLTSDLTEDYVRLNLTEFSL
jgi:glutamate N-acetyltransferase/amino-acid N-acetyltransferase